MRQAVHIFKKDVRRLLPEIAVTLLVVAAFIFLEVRRALWWPDLLVNPSSAWDLVRFLLPAAGWVLIARVIHGEALPGDRQFWLTRPYAWKSLLGAKALFILVFVNLPMLVADVIILRAYGFALPAELPGLLWYQVLLTTFFVLPMAALAALTTGFVQLLFAILVLSAGVLLWTIGPLGTGLGVFLAARNPARAIAETFGPLEWLRSSYVVMVISVATLAIVIWQYAQKRTAAGRCVAAAACLLAALGATYLPWSAALALQSRLSSQRVDPSSVRVDFDSDRKELIRAPVDKGDRIRIDIPLQITGIPDGMELAADGLIATVEAPDGVAWRSDPWTFRSAYIISAGQVVMRTLVDSSLYRKVKDEPVRLRGTLYATLFGTRRTASIPFQVRSVLVPEVGVCSTSWGEEGKGNFLICRHAFRSYPGYVSVHFADFRADTFREASISYSPFPAELSLSPLSQFFASSFREHLPVATVVTVEPLAHIRRDFEISDLRLQ